MEEAEYCHRLALMNRGRLIALDRPQGLKQTIREPILEVLTSDAPKAVEALRDATGILEVTMFGRALHAMVEDKTAGEREISQRLTEAGHSIDSIQSIEPSLEDVFVALVQRSGGTVAG
jgi:ABC-2 type transport system ATP-binding protein